MNAAALGLSSEDLATLLAILDRYIPRAEVWAFGSRVQGTARPFSDLDLVMVQDAPIDAQTKAELRYALSESSLPIKIDLVEWSRTQPAFREAIRENYVQLKSARAA
jgi:uncharacterized protein